MTLIFFSSLIFNCGHFNNSTLLSFRLSVLAGFFAWYTKVLDFGIAVDVMTMMGSPAETDRDRDPVLQQLVDGPTHTEDTSNSSQAPPAPAVHDLAAAGETIGQVTAPLSPTGVAISALAAQDTAVTDTADETTTAPALAATTFSAQEESEETMAFDGDVGSTTLAERTLVGDGEGDDMESERRKQRQHVRGASSSSLSLPMQSLHHIHQHENAGKASLESQRGTGSSMDRKTEGTTATAWDPLHTNAGEKATEKDGLHDETVIVEEGERDIVDSKGKLLYSEDEDDGPRDRAVGGGQAGRLGIKPSPLSSRRASHLRLDLKAPSPPPWEQINPPVDNNLKSIAGYYSPSASQKFRTLQSNGYVFSFSLDLLTYSDFGCSARPLIPQSSYYFGPPGPDSAYGTAPTGQIGVHHPREILRLERDYSGGELIQFAPIYPLELEGRVCAALSSFCCS